MPTYDVENQAYVPDDQATGISIPDTVEGGQQQEQVSPQVGDSGNVPDNVTVDQEKRLSVPPEPDTDGGEGFKGVIQQHWTKFRAWVEANHRPIAIVFYIILALVWFAYLIAALVLNFHPAIPLLVITIMGILLVLYYQLYVPFLSGKVSDHIGTPIGNLWSKVVEYRWIKIVAIVLGVLVIIGILIYDTYENPRRLIPLVGLTVYILLLFAFSKHPCQVKWRPVVWGIGLQVIFGLIVLRWTAGRQLFAWISQRVTGFLGFVNAGTSFVYGFTANPPRKLQQDYFVGLTFAFGILPVIFFFSSFVSVLYYWGVIQWIVARVGWIMQRSLNTTAVESLSCAANVFLSMTESPLLIKPFFDKLTHSEVHAVMTGGFATIAGSVFATYVRFGACASHILSASVMSAPAALATSKLFYPETEESPTKDIKELKLPKGEESNVLEAASNGASQAIEIVMNIIANLIVYVSLLAFLNYMLSWFAMLVNVEGLTFEKVISYMFFPLAFLMGSTDSSDTDVVLDQTFKVSQLMGIKTFLNEFVAYQRLGEMIYCCQIFPRSELIATYSLCGFSNPGSIGIQIGCLSAMCPAKKSTFSQVAVRAMICGSVACFMTACVAGILVTETPECADPNRAETFKDFNCTIKFGESRNVSCSRYKALYG